MGRIDHRAAAALAAALALFAAVAAGVPAAFQLDPARVPVVEVTLREMAFAPGRIDAPAGAFTLRLVNAGSLEHDFSVDALRISPNVRPGDTVEIAVEAPPGEFAVYCSLPGHKESGMAATLAVGP